MLINCLLIQIGLCSAICPGSYLVSESHSKQPSEYSSERIGKFFRILLGKHKLKRLEYFGTTLTEIKGNTELFPIFLAKNELLFSV